MNSWFRSKLKIVVIASFAVFNGRLALLSRVSGLRLGWSGRFYRHDRVNRLHLLMDVIASLSRFRMTQRNASTSTFEQISCHHIQWIWKAYSALYQIKVQLRYNIWQQSRTANKRRILIADFTRTLYPGRFISVSTLRNPFRNIWLAFTFTLLQFHRSFYHAISQAEKSCYLVTY